MSHKHLWGCFPQIHKHILECFLQIHRHLLGCFPQIHRHLLGCFLQIHKHLLGCFLQIHRHLLGCFPQIHCAVCMCNYIAFNLVSETPTHNPTSIHFATFHHNILQIIVCKLSLYSISKFPMFCVTYLDQLVVNHGFG